MSSSSDKVTVKWLEGWVDYEEEVSRSRIKTPNPLKIGMEVHVVCTLKQQYNIYSAKILNINHHGHTDDSDSDTITNNSESTAHCSTRGATNNNTTTRNGHQHSIISKKRSKPQSSRGNLPASGTLSKKAKRHSSHDQVNAVPDQDLVIDGGKPSSGESSQPHQSHNNSHPTESIRSSQPSMMTQIAKILTELKQISKQVADLQATVSGHSCSCMGRREARSKPERVPKCVTMGDGQVQIGTEETALLMLDENDYFAVWDQVDNAKDFIVKLLPKVFSNELLKSSNFNGGQVFNGIDHIMKETLKDKEPFIAIMAQAEKEFPNSTSSPNFERQLRYAVNNKCRKIYPKSK